MKTFSSMIVFGALVVSPAVGVTPAFALVLQKTIVLQRFGERAVTTDTAVSPQVSLACSGGVGQCVYETIASIQMGGNFTASASVGMYLSIDGALPPVWLPPYPAMAAFSNGQPF